MATRLIVKEWEVEGVLTNVTSAKLSDPTGTYGVKRDDTAEVIVADGTDMTNTSTGVYEYSFDIESNVAYTAYIEIVYEGATYHFEDDLPAVVTGQASMLASYDYLLERIGHFLFGIRTGFSDDMTSDIVDCIHDGLKYVYRAHEWSYFHPLAQITTTAPYDTGTVEIASGVVTLTDGTFPSWAAQGMLKVSNQYYAVDTRDGSGQITLIDTSLDEDAGSTYELARVEYDLPANYESIDNRLTYQPGRSDFYPPVEMRDDRFIRAKQQDDPYTARPYWFSVRNAPFDATVGSRRRISFYPLADAAYIMEARMALRDTMIDATNQYPVGAEALSQLILEACLSAAEHNFEDKGAEHTALFLQMLPLAIAEDQKKTCSTSLGRDDRSLLNCILYSFDHFL